MKLPRAFHPAHRPSLHLHIVSAPSLSDPSHSNIVMREHHTHSMHIKSIHHVHLTDQPAHITFDKRSTATTFRHTLHQFIMLPLPLPLSSQPFAAQLGLTSPSLCPSSPSHPKLTPKARFRHIHRLLYPLAGSPDLNLPLPSRYESFRLRKRRRTGRPDVRNVDIGKRRSIRDIEEIFTPVQLEKEMEIYAPVVSVRPVEPVTVGDLVDSAGVKSASAPLDPSRQVTPGYTTCLSIRLIPTAIAPKPAASPYPDLFAGMLSTLQSFDKLSRQHIMPLMYRIQSLGLDRGDTPMQMTFDCSRSCLCLTFPGRSTEDLKVLFGDMLVGGKIGMSEWRDDDMAVMPKGGEREEKLDQLGLPPNGVRRSVASILRPRLRRKSSGRMRDIRAWAYTVGKLARGRCGTPSDRSSTKSSKSSVGSSAGSTLSDRGLLRGAEDSERENEWETAKECLIGDTNGRCG